MTPDLDGYSTDWTEGDATDRAVWAYLESIERDRPRNKRGRKRTPDSIAKRLATVESELVGAVPMKRLQLMQEQRDLRAELDALDAVDSGVSPADYESDFVEVARLYGERRGITYAAWREVGVPAQLLRSAGIARRG